MIELINKVSHTDFILISKHCQPKNIHSSFCQVKQRDDDRYISPFEKLINKRITLMIC